MKYIIHVHISEQDHSFYWVILFKSLGRDCEARAGRDKGMLGLQRFSEILKRHPQAYLFNNFASQAGRAPQQRYANYCGPFYPPNPDQTDNNGRQLATTPGSSRPTRVE